VAGLVRSQMLYPVELRAQHIISHRVTGIFFALHKKGRCTIIIFLVLKYKSRSAKGRIQTE